MIDLRAALRLYLVADPNHARGDLVNSVESALRGGVTMVQLRAKELTDREQLSLAITLRELCQQSDAAFIVNDRLDIALASGADGVHLGVDDLPLEVARELAGPEMIIGYSPETDEQLRTAAVRGADYLGVGPVFGTSTKSDAGAALGLNELKRRLELGRLPAVGIGGITSENATSVITAGADGVAVVSAILKAADPEAAARQISLNSNSSSTRGSSAGSQ